MRPMNLSHFRVVAAVAAWLIPGPGFAADARVEWVKIPGGSFRMGQDNRDEGPVHHVKLKAFELAKYEVTVAQYRACVEAGICSPVDAKCLSASGLPAGDEHPVRCVDWNQARIFSEWAGGRLPSEAEWEYAARGGGKKQKYPWGDEAPTCAHAAYGDPSCGKPAVFPVCSKPLGNTAQGLCDMGGNATEWVADIYHISYQGAPADGRAWDSAEYLLRGARGGGWFERAPNLRVSKRGFSGERNQCQVIGIRPVREVGASGTAGGVDWIKIPGGKLDETPVKPFEMARAEVTFKQYHDCVRAGACTAEDSSCAAADPELKLASDDRPVICVDWFQAQQFSRWAGGRLPTDAEWEYAARSAGKKRLYPWGDKEPACDQAAFNGETCGVMTTRAVCSSPKGNTEQGLCDMAGNVGEWVEDRYLDPAAGKELGSTVRPHRGGSWYDGNDALRAASRDMADQDVHNDDIGFRPARSLKD